MNGLPYQQLPELKDNPDKESSKKNNRDAEEPKPFAFPEPTPLTAAEKELFDFLFGRENNNSAEKANQSKEKFIEFPTENPFENTTAKFVKTPSDFKAGRLYENRKEISKKNQGNFEKPKPLAFPEPTPDTTTKKDLLSFSFEEENKNSAKKENQSKEKFIKLPTENPWGNTTPEFVKTPIDYEYYSSKFPVTTLNNKMKKLDLEALRQDKKKWIEEINNMLKK